jgi:hypothetical protein
MVQLQAAGAGSSSRTTWKALTWELCNRLASVASQRGAAGARAAQRAARRPPPPPPPPAPPPRKKKTSVSFQFVSWPPPFSTFLKHLGLP